MPPAPCTLATLSAATASTSNLSVSQKRHALGGTHFCAHTRDRNSFPLMFPWGQNLPLNRALAAKRLAHSQRQISLVVSCPSAHVGWTGLFDCLATFPSDTKPPRSISAPERFSFYNTMNSVPAAISAQPNRLLALAGSCKIRKASASVMTTLSLSTGTTLDASPICSAW